MRLQSGWVGRGRGRQRTDREEKGAQVRWKVKVGEEGEEKKKKPNV